MTEQRVTPVVESRPVVGGAAAGQGLEMVTGTADPPSFARTLPRDAQQVRAVRLMVSQALGAWDLSGLDDAARLVATELVSNAVLHTRRGRVRVTVTRRTPRRVRIAVVDYSPELPSPQLYGGYAESGRGLAIVDALSGGRWGVDPLPWGKRVWAELEAFGASAEETVSLDGREGTV